MNYAINKDESTAALRRIAFFLPSSADGYTPVTGKADGDFTCRISKNGTDALHGGTFTEISAGNQPGMYYYETTAGEVDTEGWLLLVISCAGCVTQRSVVRVVVAEEGVITALNDIKGTDFVKDTDSLVNLGHTGADADTLETLSDQLDDTALEANAQANAAAALTAYDPPTRAEATADKDEILADVPGSVLEESVTTHKAVANSLASVLQLLKRRTLGKVVRDDDSITIYDDDGETPLATIPVEDAQYGPPS